MDRKIIRIFWMVITIPIALILVWLLVVWAFAEVPSFEELEHPDNKLATLVLADDGQVLATFHRENRQDVDYQDLSPNLVHALVATEDARFYSHSGVDIKALARVVVKTILGGNKDQGGGSTVTQQLAKNLYPREKAGKLKLALWIKPREWITAVKLERNYTKEEIIAMYFNTVPFGSNSFGVKAASATFFSKQPSDLKAEEAAVIVGMVQATTTFDPSRNPDNALRKRNFVLSKMAESKYITREECDSLQQIPITLSYQVQDHNSGLAPYFRDLIRRDMNASRPERRNYSSPDLFSADSLRWETDDFYGWITKQAQAGKKYNLDEDGLRIYTTVDARMQKYAEEAVSEHLGKTLQPSYDKELKYKRNKPFANDVDQARADRLMANARKWSDRYRLQHNAGVPDAEIMAQFSKPVRMRIFKWDRNGHPSDTTLMMTPDDSIRYYKGILRAGFMAIEPNTGHVKAYVGGPNYRYFKYDNVSQGKRQVGSTIKPFLYTLAMHEGIDPCEKVLNVSQTFFTHDGGTWTPRSTDKTDYIGKVVTLRWGLANSSNNISAYLMKRLGPEPMVDMMHKMGISSKVDPVNSICVGAADIPVREMVASYNTFPSKGVYATPIYVTRIEDNQGNVLAEFTNKKREAISEETAYLMIKMMRGVVDMGTANRLRGRYGLKGPIAGKTGTTNDNSDGWFIGYTPFITAGVWVGCEDREAHFTSMASGQGANSALPIWGLFMKKCLADPKVGFNESDTFIAPPGMSSDLYCEGGDLLDSSSEASEGQDDTNFFNF